MIDDVPITVYTREDCHLCDQAVETIERIAGEEDVAVDVEEVDIDEDPDLYAEYHDRIPYVLIEGTPKFKYQVDPGKVRSELRRR